jgi:hypothetical protein
VKNFAGKYILRADRNTLLLKHIGQVVLIQNQISPVKACSGFIRNLSVNMRQNFLTGLGSPCCVFESYKGIAE